MTTVYEDVAGSFRNTRDTLSSYGISGFYPDRQAEERKKRSQIPEVPKVPTIPEVPKPEPYRAPLQSPAEFSREAPELSELEVMNALAEARIAESLEMPMEQLTPFLDPEMDPNAFRNVMFGLNPIAASVGSLLIPREGGGNRALTPPLPEGFFGAKEELGRLYGPTEALRSMTSPAEFLAILGTAGVGAPVSLALRGFAPAARAVGPPVVGKGLELGVKGLAAVARPFKIGKGALPVEAGAVFLASVGIAELNKALPENTPTALRVIASVATVVLGGTAVFTGPRVIISAKNTAKAINDVKKAMEVRDTLTNESAWQNSRNAAQRYKDATTVTRAVFKSAKEKGYQGPEIDFTDMPAWRSPAQQAAEAEWRYTDLEEMGRAVPRYAEAGGGIYREPFTREQARLVAGGLDEGAEDVARIIPEEIPQVHGRGDYLKALENKLTAKLPKEVKGDFIGQSETGPMEPVPARIYGDYAIVKNPNKFVGYDVNHIPSGLKIGSQKKLSDAKRQIQVSMSLVKPEISALTADQMRQLPKGDTTITKLALAWRYVDNPSSIDQLRYESAYPGAKLWYDSQPRKSVLAEQINPGIAGTKASTANSTTNLHFGEVVYIGDNPQPYKVDRQNGLLIDLDKIPFDDSVGGHRGLSAGPTYDMGRDGPLIRSGFDYKPGDAAIPRRDAPIDEPAEVPPVTPTKSTISVTDEAGIEDVERTAQLQAELDANAATANAAKQALADVQRRFKAEEITFEEANALIKDIGEGRIIPAEARVVDPPPTAAPAAGVADVGKSTSELSEEVTKLVGEVADAEKAAKSWGLGEKAPKGVTQEQRRALERRNADEVDRLEKNVKDAVARRDAAKDRFFEAEGLARGFVDVEYKGKAIPAGFLPKTADDVAARLNANPDDDWSYVVRHDPEGKWDSRINIFDEDGKLVGPVTDEIAQGDASYFKTPTGERIRSDLIPDAIPVTLDPAEYKAKQIVATPEEIRDTHRELREGLTPDSYESQQDWIQRQQDAEDELAALSPDDVPGSHVGTGFRRQDPEAQAWFMPETANFNAWKLTEEAENGWTYIARHNPKKMGASYIEILDANGKHLDNVTNALISSRNTTHAAAGGLTELQTGDARFMVFDGERKLVDLRGTKSYDFDPPLPAETQILDKSAASPSVKLTRLQRTHLKVGGATLPSTIVKGAEDIARLRTALDEAEADLAFRIDRSQRRGHRSTILWGRKDAFDDLRAKLDQLGTPDAAKTLEAAQTGQPFQARLFRGQGGVSRGGIKEGGANIVGEGRYSTPSQGYAKIFGPDVQEVDVTLQNPLVIRTDAEYAKVIKDAGLGPTSMGQARLSDPENLSVAANNARIAQFRNYVDSQGYDGIVFDPPVTSDAGQRLLEDISESQVVEFSRTEPADAAADAPMGQATFTETGDVGRVIVETPEAIEARKNAKLVQSGFDFDASGQDPLIRTVAREEEARNLAAKEAAKIDQDAPLALQDVSDEAIQVRRNTDPDFDNPVKVIESVDDLSDKAYTDRLPVDESDGLSVIGARLDRITEELTVAEKTGDEALKKKLLKDFDSVSEEWANYEEPSVLEETYEREILIQQLAEPETNPIADFTYILGRANTFPEEGLSPAQAFAFEQAVRNYSWQTKSGARITTRLSPGPTNDPHYINEATRRWGQKPAGAPVEVFFGPDPRLNKITDKSSALYKRLNNKRNWVVRNEAIDQISSELIAINPERYGGQEAIFALREDIEAAKAAQNDWKQIGQSRKAEIKDAKLANQEILERNRIVLRTADEKEAILREAAENQSRIASSEVLGPGAIERADVSGEVYGRQRPRPATSSIGPGGEGFDPRAGTRVESTLGPGEEVALGPPLDVGYQGGAPVRQTTQGRSFPKSEYRRSVELLKATSTDDAAAKLAADRFEFKDDGTHHSERAASMFLAGDGSDPFVFARNVMSKTQLEQISERFRWAIANPDVKFIGFDEISPRQGFRTSVSQIADQSNWGVSLGPLTDDVMIPNQQLSLASREFQKWAINRINQVFVNSGVTKQDKKIYKAASDLLEVIGRKEVTASKFTPETPPAVMLLDDNVKSILKNHKIGKEDKIKSIRLAQEARVYFDEMRDLMNVARLRRGEKAIQYKLNYRLHIRETHDWGAVGGWLEQSPLDERVVPDFIHPSKVFVARDMYQKGNIARDELETSILKLMESYAGSTQKDLFGTEIIRNTKRHTKLLRGVDKPNLADAFDNWVYETYAGVPTRQTKAIRDINLINTRVPLPRKVLGPRKSLPSLVDVGLIVRQNLTKAVFALNIDWNLFVQTGSAALTPIRYGARNSVKAFDVFLNKKVRDEIADRAYSYRVKTQGRTGTRGTIVMQDIGDDKFAYRPGRLDAITDITNYLSTTIEKLLTLHSTRAAYFKGQQLGFTGRGLWEFAQQGGARTQSMYNREDAVGALRSREVSAAVPFQTFSFELNNLVAELTNIRGYRTGAYRTIAADSDAAKPIIRRRLKQLLYAIALIYTTNEVADRAIDRRPWQVTSFAPYLSLLTAGFRPYEGVGSLGILPIRASTDVWNAFTLWMKNGDATGIRQTAFKYGGVPAGVQLNTTLDAFIATKEGGVRDISGKKKFDVSKPLTPADYYNTYVGGVYRTNEGAEYLEERLDKSFIEEMLGLSLPFSGGKTGALRKRWKQEINQYYDIPADYKKLSRTEKEELEDRFGIPYGTDRIKFRKANPEIDAHLFIAGNLSSLQTGKAKRIAKQIIIEENIKATDLDEDRYKIYKKVLGKFWVTENMGSKEEIQELSPLMREGIEPLSPARPSSTPTPVTPAAVPPTAVPPTIAPLRPVRPAPTPEPASSLSAEESWDRVSSVLTQGDLIALQKVWFGDSISRQESASLRVAFNKEPLGQSNFKTWMKQTLRQVQENAAVAKSMRSTRELVTV